MNMQAIHMFHSYHLSLSAVDRVTLALSMRVRIPRPLFILEPLLLRLALPLDRPILFGIHRQLLGFRQLILLLRSTKESAYVNHTRTWDVPSTGDDIPADPLLFEILVDRHRRQPMRTPKHLGLKPCAIREILEAC